MSYKLLSQVHESVRDLDEYNRLVEQVIDTLGFDRSSVIHTEKEFEAFLESISDRPLLEMGGRALGMVDPGMSDQSAAQARSGEREWMNQADKQQEKPGIEYGPRKLGLTSGKVNPKEGQRVVLPGKAGIGQITALDLEHGQAMIRDKNGREFVVKRDELVGPRMVGNEATWMIQK